MTAPCASPVPAERLLEYFLGELTTHDEDQLEAHLFTCAPCAAEAESLAGLAGAIHRAITPILTRSRLEALESAGLVERENVMRPGELAQVLYPAPGKALVLRLGGAELAQARRLDVEMRTRAGEAVGRLDDVPFDASRGEVLVACQRHFAERFPPDLVFVLEVVSADERRPVAEYTVLHRFA